MWSSQSGTDDDESLLEYYAVQISVLPMIFLELAASIFRVALDHPPKNR